MKFESAKGEAYKERFKVFFSTKVAFFDLAIWSNELTTPGEIQHQLRARMKERGIAAVKVYARNEANIEKVQRECAKYLEEDTEAQLESDERYRICHSPSCCVTLTKKVRQPPPGIFKKARRHSRRR
ncbi:MAG: hypothetical protein E6K14_03940 [Methanobacteriota archaeon]|nr:MAG: hypothetical protein E6K14_03940 [Euryarchaeota archaeon]